MEYDDIPENPVLAGSTLVGGDIAKVMAPMSKAEIVAAHEYVTQTEDERYR